MITAEETKGRYVKPDSVEEYRREVEARRKKAMEAERANAGKRMSCRPGTGDQVMARPMFTPEELEELRRFDLYQKQEENQMVKIYKALMAVAEDNIGEIRTAKLLRKEPNKHYTSDEIIISGFAEDGRAYTLRLEYEDLNADS